jgi:hypothetical protein
MGEGDIALVEKSILRGPAAASTRTSSSRRRPTMVASRDTRAEPPDSGIGCPVGIEVGGRRPRWWLRLVGRSRSSRPIGRRSRSWGRFKTSWEPAAQGYLQSRPCFLSSSPSPCPWPSRLMVIRSAKTHGALLARPRPLRTRRNSTPGRSPASAASVSFAGLWLAPGAGGALRQHGGPAAGRIAGRAAGCAASRPLVHRPGRGLDQGGQPPLAIARHRHSRPR